MAFLNVQSRHQTPEHQLSQFNPGSLLLGSRPLYPTLPRLDRQSEVAFLLEGLRQLPRGAQQIKLGLLMRVLRIEKGKPLLIFIELRAFQIANTGASLLKLRLQ